MTKNDGLEPGELRWALTDRNFSVIAVTDDGGDVLERTHYLAYGDSRTGLSTDHNGDGDTNTLDSLAVQASFNASVPSDRLCVEANVVGYAGYAFEPSTGLYCVRHRWYEPGQGRWTKRDPLGYVDGQNVYEYVNHQPTTAVDPWGLKGYHLVASDPEGINERMLSNGTWQSTGGHTKSHVDDGIFYTITHSRRYTTFSKLSYDETKDTSGYRKGKVQKIVYRSRIKAQSYTAGLWMSRSDPTKVQELYGRSATGTSSTGKVTVKCDPQTGGLVFSHSWAARGAGLVGGMPKNYPLGAEPWTGATGFGLTIYGFGDERGGFMVYQRSIISESRKRCRLTGATTSAGFGSGGAQVSMTLSLTRSERETISHDSGEHLIQHVIF